MNIKQRLMLGLMTTILIITTSVVARALAKDSVGQKIPAAVVAQAEQIAPGGESQAQSQITEAIVHDNASFTVPTKVDQIVIDGPYALAVFLVGEHGGGMAVLMQKPAGWEVLSSDGGAFDSRDLVGFGFPPETARSLLQRLEQ